MLDREYITPLEYNKLNNVIADTQTENTSDEQMEDEDVRTQLKNTIDYVTQLDKQELSALLMELRDDVGEESLDTVFELELLPGKFLIDEFEGGQPLLPMIEEQRLKLEVSPASMSKLLQVKMLLDDINNNRRRVQETFNRINNAEDNEEDIWKILVREAIISTEQFENLSKLENTELEDIASILKDVKIGQGTSFLPTTMTGLRTMFSNWRGDNEEQNITCVKRTPSSWRCH